MERIEVDIVPQSYLDNLKIAEAHHGAERFAEALASYLDCMRIWPAGEEAHFGYGCVAYERAHVADEEGRNIPVALEMFQRVLSLNPRHAGAYVNMAGVLHRMGDVDGALAAIDKALEIAPDMAVPHSTRLFLLLSHPKWSHEAVVAETRRWREQYVATHAEHYHDWPNKRDQDRTLRVGYVSSCLQNHPIERFLRPILSHHSPRVETFIYDLVANRNVTYHTFAERIRTDGIDVLVDLDGHTCSGRPLLFAMRPAPVSVHYLSVAGDPMTTDYYITDRWLTPKGDPRALYVKSFWCYQPPAGCPELGPLPALISRTITFGCLANHSKVTLENLQTWRRILERCPGTRFILFCPSGWARERAQGALGEEVCRRTEFLNRQGLDSYLKTFNRIDISLDPWPCGGGTVTCDALWMGNALVTLAGDKPVSRSGASLLVHGDRLLGNYDVTNDVEGYVHLACSLAAESSRDDLILYRAKARQRLVTSHLMSVEEHVLDLENAYREAWHRFLNKEKAGG